MPARVLLLTASVAALCDSSQCMDKTAHVEAGVPSALSCKSSAVLQLFNMMDELRQLQMVDTVKTLFPAGYVSQCAYE